MRSERCAGGRVPLIKKGTVDSVITLPNGNHAARPARGVVPLAGWNEVAA
jgi:hypothetical protein